MKTERAHQIIYTQPSRSVAPVFVGETFGKQVIIRKEKTAACPVCGSILEHIENQKDKEIVARRHLCRKCSILTSTAKDGERLPVVLCACTWAEVVTEWQKYHAWFGQARGLAEAARKTQAEIDYILKGNGAGSLADIAQKAQTQIDNVLKGDGAGSLADTARKAKAEIDNVLKGAGGGENAQ